MASNEENTGAGGWGLVHFSANRRNLQARRDPQIWTCPLSPRPVNGCHHGAKRAVWATLLALAAGALAWQGRAEACSVPVFRYALERFPSDPYEFVVFHRGPLSAEDKKVIAATEKLAEDENWPVNLRVRLVDLAAKPAEKPAEKTPEKPIGDGNGLTKAGTGTLTPSGTNRDNLPVVTGELPVEKPAWTPPSKQPLPCLAVMSPRGEDALPIWSGRLRADDIQELVDSPARREVAHRLMKGDSAVFLLLESGRGEADKKAAQLLQAELAKMEKANHLPPDDGTGGPRSSLPLRISFSMLRIARDNPAERGLVKLLCGGSAEARRNTGPIVYPVFGRGRILTELAGKAITPDALQEFGDFLCGPCSCSLKGQLPGADLLMAAAWDTILQGEKISEDSPALAGLVPLARAAAAARTPPVAKAASVLPASAGAQPEATAGPPRHDTLLLSLAATLAVAVALVAAASIFLKSLHRKGIG